jgi:glycosyltransferase involved in cell wall biosynthesis
MRILRVISSMDPKSGGPSEGVRQISNALEAEGHATEIVSLDVPESPWITDSPWSIHALGPAIGSYCFSSRLSPWIRERTRDFDCVIIHGLWQYASLGTWRSLRRASTPYFVYTHGMLDPWFQDAHPIKHVKKSVYWRLAEHRVLRDARAVLFTSEEESFLASRSFRPYRCNSVTVNYGTAGPPGRAEDDHRALRENLPDLVGRRYLLFLGRIHPKKGCDLLLEAFATAAASDPDLMLVMAGPDQLGWANELMRRAVDLGIDRRVRWVGMLTGALKWGVIRSAEAFVLPSHQENFGIAVAEALSCGVPVLISDKVNIWREIQADGAGFVGADNLEGTIQILKKWVSQSASEKKLAISQASDCFANRFHIQGAASNLLQVLREHGVTG